MGWVCATMNEWMGGRMDGWKNGWDEWMYGWKDERGMGGRTEVWMDGWKD